MSAPFPPPHAEPDRASACLRERGYVVLAPSGLSALTGGEVGELAALERHWSDLPLDDQLRDGGRYRHRRHGSFVLDSGVLSPVPHRAHWQPREYNALHGGIERWFEPLPAELLAAPAWRRLVLGLSGLASDLRASRGPWFIEAHAFRITTFEGIGRPTPEGAHRDGVDQVAVVLVGQRGIKGGETRVFDARGPNGQRFTMTEPGTTLVMDDARTIHETTPIQPARAGETGWRDTLVLTWRLGGFQEPAGEPR